MLKTLTPCLLNSQTQTKCGEIFCDTLKDFTIFCCFCQIKLFAYEDFLQHIQNAHFEVIINDCKKINENEEFIDENHHHEVVEEMESCDTFSDYKDAEDPANSSEEETMKVIKVRPRFGKATRNVKENIIEKEHNYSEEPLQFSAVYEIGDPVSPKHKFETLICPDCQELFFLKKDYDQHVVEQHMGHKCPKCEMRFRHRHHLRRHLQNMHEESEERNKNKYKRLKERIHCPYPECPKSFSLQASLNYHLEFHTMKCTFRCDFDNCIKTFPTQLRLEQHQEKHTTERKFICDFENCGKAFVNNHRLKVHQEVHALAKRYICDTCGYSCRASTTLRIHKRTHTGERPFTCKICENSFMSQATLHLHMNTHATIRPFVCQICQATFANRQIMERHAFTHSKEKLFKCQLCDKAFKQPHGLDGHMRRLHLEPRPKKVRYFKNISNSPVTTQSEFELELSTATEVK